MPSQELSQAPSAPPERRAVQSSSLESEVACSQEACLVEEEGVPEAVVAPDSEEGENQW